MKRKKKILLYISQGIKNDQKTIVQLKQLRTGTKTFQTFLNNMSTKICDFRSYSWYSRLYDLTVHITPKDRITIYLNETTNKYQIIEQII